MKHEMKVHFPENSDVVIKAFTDKDFHTGKLEQMGISNYQVLDHQFDGHDFSIRISRKVPLDVPVPGALKRLIGNGEIPVIHEDCWNVASRRGYVNMDIQGMPINLHCELSLDDEAGGCVYTYLWDIQAHVPLLASKVEKTLVADLEQKVPAENRASIALLDNYV